MELKTISLTDTENYRVQGRTTEERDPLTLLWSGSSLDLCVQCSELWVEMEGPFETLENWAAFEVNGAVLARQMVNPERSWVCVFRARNAAKPTDVRIIKEVQAMNADPKHCIKIHRLRLDGELLPVAPKKHKIEFIGDSVTSAEGAIGDTKEEDWIAMFFSHVHSYPYMVSKELDAEYHIVSQSGWGTYVSWDNRKEYVIPRYYEQICGLVPAENFAPAGFHEKNDFSKWQPDVICVNLGTNDDGAFQNPAFTDPVTGETTGMRMDGDVYNEEDRQNIRQAMQDFLVMLRKDNPKAQILWCFGILGDRMGATIREAIAEYTKASGDTHVEYLAIPETTPETVGARWHPGYAAHRAAADVIVKRIRQIL